MMRIRDATADDAVRLAEIYGHHVLQGLGTFEEDPPSPEEMRRRLTAVQGLGLPYLVAEEAGRVIGYAYAGPFRLRAAYRYAVEDSVYIAPDAIGRGVGRAVLTPVIDRCEAMGLRRMIAVIGDSGNVGSIGLHKALAFEPGGVLPGAGFKHGRWVDVLWMHRPLGAGDAALPDRDGLAL